MKPIPHQRPKPHSELLQGWGRTKSGRAQTYQPQILDQLLSALNSRETNRVLGIGSSRSYGDAGLNTGQIAIKFLRMDHVHEFDLNQGSIIAEAGLNLKSLLELTVPSGWFLPVIPGTLFPTLGGCLAADIHGKNHHQAGSFSQHVEWVELVTAAGEIVRCSITEHTDLFEATAGGMGLTGLIYRMKLRLLKINTAYIILEKIPCRNLSELMSLLKLKDQTYAYTVAWVDCAAQSHHTGRGTVILGRHAEPQELPAEINGQNLFSHHRNALSIPSILPINLVNRLTIKSFNDLFYYKDERFGSGQVCLPYETAFCPLDAIGNWNRVYGQRGFIQYQFVIPFAEGFETIRRIIRTFQQQGHIPALAVLKRFGEQDGLLSFPQPGWTLALDLAWSQNLLPILNRMDEEIADLGGKIYLAKDATLSPQNFRRMYPKYNSWREIKAQIDPENIFSSDLSRRLQI